MLQQGARVGLTFLSPGGAGLLFVGLRYEQMLSTTLTVHWMEEDEVLFVLRCCNLRKSDLRSFRKQEGAPDRHTYVDT